MTDDDMVVVVGLSFVRIEPGRSQEADPVETGRVESNRRTAQAGSFVPPVDGTRARQKDVVDAEDRARVESARRKKERTDEKRRKPGDSGGVADAAGGWRGEWGIGDWREGSRACAGDGGQI